MAEHHPLPALPPQHQQPNHHYHQQAPDSYDNEQSQFPPYQQQYDQPQPVQPPPNAQAQSQSHAQNQPPHRRSKSRPRTFSFQSNKSHKSSGSHPKIDLHETPEEKEAKRLHSKADPTVAMSEAEPCMSPLFCHVCCKISNSFQSRRSGNDQDFLGSFARHSTQGHHRCPNRYAPALNSQILPVYSDHAPQPNPTDLIPHVVVGNDPLIPFAVSRPPSMEATVTGTGDSLTFAQIQSRSKHGTDVAATMPVSSSAHRLIAERG